MVVLLLHAHAARAAVERARRPQHHAGDAQRQRVHFLVRVYDHGVLESIVREEVVRPIAASQVVSLAVRLVLDGESGLPLRYLVNLGAALARHRRDHSRLRVRAPVDQPEQVQHADHVEYVHDEGSDQAK